MTRTVEMPVGDGVQPLSGLFACYRKPAAAEGPPTCYLASYVWRFKDLTWPGSGEDATAAPLVQARICSDDNGCDLERTAPHAGAAGTG